LWAIFDPVTAPFFKARVPTLFLGSVNVAYDTPPRATNSASDATTEIGG
jgi:hypothetical protein